MAKLAPTLDELKAELRIDFEADDAIIQNYIDAAAGTIQADMHWARVDNPTIEISPARLQRRDMIRLPIRGIEAGAVTLNYFASKDATETTAMTEYTARGGAPATAATINNDIQPNRYISWLVPGDEWGFIFGDDIDRHRNISITATSTDAPPLILMAMRKIAVDLYRSNGIGTVQMRTAVDRMLRPIRDAM